MSPDGERLYVNVRSWPRNALPTSEQAPPIATAIEMHEIDVGTLEPTGRVRETGSMKGSAGHWSQLILFQILVGHYGYTPTEKAFYLYCNVSAELLSSGSESSFGCVWDRAHGALVAKLGHEECVNCVALDPKDQVGTLRSIIVGQSLFKWTDHK